MSRWITEISDRYTRNGSVFCMLLILLAGCSNSNHSPAPVTSVQGYKTELKSPIYASSYRVQKGETLYAIAWRSNQNFKYLAALNHIADPYQIYPGQVLKLTGKVPTKPVYKKPAVVTTASTKPAKSNATTKNTLKAPSRPLTKPAKVQSVSKAKPVAKPKPVTATASTANSYLSNSKLSWAWPASGKLISTYSNSKSGQQGINVAGALGRSVTASESGRVVYSGNGLRGYGNLIIIKHNDDYLSAYAYNQSLLVKEQQWVKAGQRIATMGNSGPNSGAELYFEIRFRGKPVNPMRYLPKR